MSHPSVKPTEDMQIKDSIHVDPDGKVRLPYLTEWSHLLHHNLDTLIQKCAAIFSRQPPVFEKPKQQHLPAQRVMEVDGIQAWVHLFSSMVNCHNSVQIQNTSYIQMANSLFHVLY